MSAWGSHRLRFRLGKVRCDASRLLGHDRRPCRACLATTGAFGRNFGLIVDPFDDNVCEAGDVLVGEDCTLVYLVPHVEAIATACGGRVLRYKNRMSTPRGLFSVVEAQASNPLAEHGTRVLFERLIRGMLNAIVRSLGPRWNLERKVECCHGRFIRNFFFFPARMSVRCKLPRRMRIHGARRSLCFKDVR